MTTLLPAVQLRDQVPARSVDDLIAAVTAGIDHLYQQVLEAERDAAEAERRLAELQAVPEGTGDRVAQLHVSIGQLTRSGGQYFRKELESARARASARLAEAHAQAEWLLMDAREQVASRLATTGADTESVALVQATTALVAPLVVAPPAAPEVAPVATFPVSAPAARAAAAIDPDPQRVAEIAPDPETEQQFRSFWQPEEAPARVHTGPLEGMATALVPVLVAAMGALVLLVVVALLVWIG